MTPQELTNYRNSLNLNKQEMGAHLGVTGAAIGLWEAGKNMIPPLQNWTVSINGL